MAMKSVVKKTITHKQMAELNRSLLLKLQKKEEANAIVAYTEEPKDVQRVRVQPNDIEVQYKFNKNKVGVVRNYDLTEDAALTHYIFGLSTDNVDYHRKRILTIYQKKVRATQDTPKQTYSVGWQAQHEPIKYFKSPLMHWAKGTEDPFTDHVTKYANLECAILSTRQIGSGYDILMPRFR